MTGPDEGGFPGWLATSWAVRRAGGRPVRITPVGGVPDGPLHGLVLGGGADVAPDRYGVDPEEDEPPPVGETLRGTSAGGKLRALASYVVSPAVYLVRRLFSVRIGGLDHPRDELEIGLLRRADRAKLPVLGICRGAQLMNVYSGGTLHRDLSSFYSESAHPWTVFPRKWVAIEPESALARALGRRRCRVNSLHRQAVDRLGRTLVATAREDTGMVQGVERPTRPFFIGVQWHPEYLPQRPEQRQLFLALVQEARRHAGSRIVRAVPLGVDQEVSGDLAVPEEDGEGEEQPEHG